MTGIIRQRRVQHPLHLRLRRQPLRQLHAGLMMLAQAQRHAAQAALRQIGIGRQPVGIGFASAASDPRYDNKRTEMYFQAVEWIKQGGALPPETAEGIPELIAALSQTTYSFRGDRLLLEPKEQVKARLGHSPDEADAFALTFAQPATRAGLQGGAGRRFCVMDFDPLDRNWRAKARAAGHYLVD